MAESSNCEPQLQLPAELQFLKTLDVIQKKFGEAASSGFSEAFEGRNDPSSIFTSTALNFDGTGPNPFLAGEFLSQLAASSSSFMQQTPTSSGQGICGGGQVLARNSTKTLKCPKCNWHYKYQETLEIHMKEKHADAEVVCVYCVDGRPHPKLARGETYSCGYKPYRCDLCKYSTTTKGNLSIHMQSDKHLHALQEMPQSMTAPLQMMFSGDANGPNNDNMPFPTSLLGGSQAIPNQLQCLICLNFASDSYAEMAEHMDRDRQNPSDGDILTVNGIFHCILCTYNTHLKANFQLHTRTDKHIQKVQLMNHMREGGSIFNEHSPLSRLGSFKSTVNVRCQPCQQTFSCLLSLREHCESHIHQENVTTFKIRVHLRPRNALNPVDSNFGKQQEISAAEATIQQVLNCLYVRCSICNSEGRPFETDIGEIPADETASSEENPWTELNSFWMQTGEAMMISASTADTDGTAEVAALTAEPSSKMTQTAMTAASVSEQQQSDKHLLANHDAISDGERQKQEQCPLCLCQHSQLRKHLLEDHKIAQEMVDRLLIAVFNSDDSPAANAQNKEAGANDPENRPGSKATEKTLALDSVSTSPTLVKSAIYRFPCPQCKMAFRSATQLHTHSLKHSSTTLKPVYRCPHDSCTAVFHSLADFRNHVNKAHETVSETRSTGTTHKGHQCGICGDGEHFPDDAALFAHLNSATHLQKALQHVAEQNQSFLRPLETAAAIPDGCESPFKNQLLAMLGRNSVGPLAHFTSRPQNDSTTSLLPPPGNPFPLKSAASTSRSKTTETFSSAFERAATNQRPDIDINNLMGKTSTASNIQQPVNNMASMRNGFASSPLFNHLLNKNASPPATSATSSSSPQAQQNALALAVAHMVQANPSVTNYFPPFAAANAAFMAHLAGMNHSDEGFSEVAANLFDMNQPTGGGEKKTGKAAHRAKHSYDFPSFMDDDNNNESNRNLSVPPSNNSFYTDSSSTSPPKAKRARAGSASAALKNSADENSIVDRGIQQQQKLSAAAGFPQQQMDAGALNWMMAAMGGMGGFPLFAAMAAASAANPEMMANGMFSLSNLSAERMDASANETNGNQQTTTTTNSSRDSPPSRYPKQPQSSSSTLVEGSNNSSTLKRARTRIGDLQLKILRQYFDINNSPSEDQIKEMAEKAQLPEKVIKHWFRNTLFKERQRNLDSPYNFSIPPQMSIDLAAYQKTGETKIIPVKHEAKSDEASITEEHAEIAFKPVEPQNNSVPNKGATNDDIKSSGQLELSGQAQTSSSTFAEPASVGADDSSAQSSRFSTPSLAAVNKLEQTDSSYESPTNNHDRGNENLTQTQMDAANEFLANFNKAMAAAATASSQQASAHQQTQNPFAALFNAASFSEPTSSTSEQQQQFPTIFTVPGLPGLPFPFMTPVSASGCFPQNTVPSSPTTYSSSHGIRSFPPLSPGPLTANSTTSSLQHISGTTPPNSLMSSALGGGRRANRTRFTDSQLKRLQNFFDKQAYPKDEDVEYLSNTLKLSPRVIVVWFQNARQKARKIYENQPNLTISTGVRIQHSDGTSSLDGSRAGRTSGGGFQCKRCEQSFQRYFELIHHQQQNCYKGESEAQHSDNKSMEENLSEDERANSSNGHFEEKKLPAMFDSFSTVANIMNSTNPFSSLFSSRIPNGIETTADDIDSDGQLHQQIKVETDIREQHIANQDKLRQKELLKQLMEQPLANFEVPTGNHNSPTKLFSETADTLLTAGGYQQGNGYMNEGRNSPLDLRTSTASAALNNTTAENDQHNNLDVMPSASSLSPAAYSYSIEDNDDFDGLNSNRSSQSPMQPFGTFPFGTNKQPMTTEQLLACASSQFNPNGQTRGHSSASKRFRTHLTPIQVYIMKSLFNDYKTPSMNECETLGAKIGLQRRVVQVWFQNARAKERKAAGEDGISVSSSVIVPSASGTPKTHCEPCDTQFDGRMTIQEHIFTDEHIERIRERGVQIRLSARNSTELTTSTSTHNEKPLETSAGERSSSSGNDLKISSIMGNNISSSSNGSPFMHLPYNLMLNTAVGLPATMIPPFFADPNIMGTPVHALKIPEEVMEQISNDILAKKDSTKFTQDGLSFAQLQMNLSEEDFKHCTSIESEVGWACPKCQQIFQQIDLLKTHQRLICSSGQQQDDVFSLIQIHYQCSPCSLKFGTQEELSAHFQSDSHNNSSNNIPLKQRSQSAAV